MHIKPLYREFAIRLFKEKIIIFGEFQFKLHENHSVDDFLAKLNLRMFPKGNLTWDLALVVGEIYVDIVRENGLKFDVIAGLPVAGDPLAQAFIAKGGAKPEQCIFLTKQELPGGKRKILSSISGPFQKGQRVLGIDDVITLGDTKVEAFDAFHLNLLNITDCVCTMDWGIGGKKNLEEKCGVKTHTAFLIDNLLSIGWKNGLAEKEKCLAVIERRDRIKERIELQQ